jgi:hypothetical protein
MTSTNQNDIHDEIKSRLNSGNACYHSVQNLLSSHLISKNLKIKIYRTVILPVVLYGCETWSLTLREEYTLRVFKNRMLRRIFGPKRDEDRSWRKLHNYIKEDEVGGTCGTHGEGRGVYRVLVGRPEGGRLLVRPTHREDNIKMDLRETGINGANWIWLAQDRVQWWAVVSMIMNLQVP